MPRLPDAATFRALVDGSQRGVSASLQRGLLAGCSLPYAAAVTTRNLLYDRGWLPSRMARVPVICVGNLTLGGTGKTPLVAWLARCLLELGKQPAVVSRGYAAAKGTSGDEAAELAMLLPGVTHVANRDRVAGVEEAVRRGANVAILDDGFQHRRLARDLDIVAVDATDPFGCGHLFPRGLLREPLAGLARAGAVILTRASSVDHQRRAAIKADMLRWAHRDDLAWAEASHAPRCLRSADGSTQPLEACAGRRVLTVSGIGNPRAFQHTVLATGCTIAGELVYPDHHPYADSDLARIGRQASDASAELIVTTVKDLVKIRKPAVAGVPVVALEIAIDILTGAAHLRELVRTTIGGQPSGVSHDA